MCVVKVSVALALVFCCSLLTNGKGESKVSLGDNIGPVDEFKKDSTLILRRT